MPDRPGSLVPVPPKHLGDYAAVVGHELIEGIRERAAPFRGARVLHVNSTAFGGGVAELLYTMVPLMRDVGMDVDWRLMAGNEPFFQVTKAMHNGLQGMPVTWTKEMRALYSTVTEDNAEDFETDYDFVIIHDSQPAGILPSVAEDIGRPRGKWIWRCHIDLTETYGPVWDFVKPFVDAYDAAIFSLAEYVKPDLAVEHVAIIPPSIDPLSLKNIPLDEAMVSEVMRRYGIEMNRPLIVQVSRFDPWKDPIGVIDAFRLVRAEFPGAQLAMIASMAHDDPEGWTMYTTVDEHRAGDPDIHLLSNLNDVGSLGVNAFQRAADVVVQKSIREGFGLVVAEAMWKNKPLVGGDAGGIRLQVIDGETGYLVKSVEECAQRVAELLGDRERAREIAAAGRRRIRENFLSTRELLDHLELFEKLSR